MSKSRESRSEENADDTCESKVKAKKEKKESTDGSKRSSKKMSVDPTATSGACGDVLADLVNMEKPLKSTLTKKKSTLNRLTDLITKSPILEPLRSKSNL